MKHKGGGAVAFLSLFLASPLAAQPARELQGQVFHLGEDGRKILEPGLIVTLVETGATDDANDQGIFRLPLPPAFQPGDSVTLSIDKPGWRIRYPLDGEARVPRNLQREIVPIELLQAGSKLFWTHDRIEKLIRDASERSKQEGRRQENDVPSLDLGREIKEWAAKYGFSTQEARDEIDRWIAEVEAAHEDSYQKGLAAFAKQHFETAAERFRESAERRIRQLGETREQQETLAEKAERMQQEWAMARVNEAVALLALHRPEEAAQALSEVLEKVPDHRQAFDLLGTILNHRLFHHAEAVALTRTWLSRHPDDLRARLALGEQLFASRAFSDFNQEIASLLKEQELDASSRTVALGYAIAAGLAMDSADVPDRVEELLGVVAAQPQDFSTSWTFEGTLHSLGEDPEAPHKDLLIRLFRALEAPDRDGLLQGLRDVKEAILTEDRRAFRQADLPGRSSPKWEEFFRSLTNTPIFLPGGFCGTRNRL